MKMVRSERLAIGVSKKEKIEDYINTEYFTKTKMDRFSGTSFDI